MIKLVIFDLDQTLINTLPRFHRVFNETLAHFGEREVDWDIFIKDYANDVLNRHFNVSADEFWKYFLSNYVHRDDEDRVIDGAVEVLKYLKDEGKYIVITTGRIVPVETVREELKKFGLLEFVDRIYTRYDHYEDGKRRTEMIRKAMEEFRASENETVFVGDYWPDMVSGREVGVFTVGVLTGLESHEKLLKYGANVVIESVKYLPHIIKNLEQKKQHFK